MCVLGVLTSGVAVGFFSYSELGLDPFQCFAHGVWNLVPLSFGTWYVILNGVLLVLMAVVNRSKIGPGTLINLFLLGYVAEESEAVILRAFPERSLPLRAVMLVIGIVILCFASAMYYTADLGVSTYDAIAITLAECAPKCPFRVFRIATDLICVLVGWSLGAAVGAGTLVTAFFMGPLIDFFRNTVAEPLLKKNA
ncbi:MAG: DUF6198 family protein [Lachnospiraceae bacterium]|nr:DUF6198 family protein [Lachnospiraceae bacterium]